MLLSQHLAKVRRPRGLAVRAVLFTTLLVAVTAMVSAAIVLIGANREGERQEMSVAQRLTEEFASHAGVAMAGGDVSVMSPMMGAAAQSQEVRALSVRDAGGHVLIRAGGGDADSAVMAALAGRSLSSGATEHWRGGDGADRKSVV